MWNGMHRLPWSASIPAIILAAVIEMGIVPYMDVYAQAGSGVVCAGHTIERGNFADTDDEVKVDDTVYNAGDTITLDGKTYTVMIGNGTINGTAGNDFIVGSDGIDYISGRLGDDFIVGLAGNDDLSGDWIDGESGNDTITGGNDKLDGRDGVDNLYGDYIDGGSGIDTAYGGNDIINATDSITNNDSIDGDKIITENITLGNEDICASDPDPETNCEYDDISSLATFSPSQSVINTRQSVDLVFTSSVDDPVVITDLKVETSDGDETYARTMHSQYHQYQQMVHSQQHIQMTSEITSQEIVAIQTH